MGSQETAFSRSYALAGQGLDSYRAARTSLHGTHSPWRADRQGVHSPAGAPAATVDGKGIFRILAINSGSNFLAVASPAICACLK